MERERFNSPAESPDDSGDKKDEKSAKKKARSASDLARLLRAKESADDPKPEQPTKQATEKHHDESATPDSPAREDQPETPARAAAEQVDDSPEAVPLDELSQAEQAEVVQAIVADRLEQIAAAESADEADAADAALLARLQERLTMRPSGSEQSLDAIIEEVYNETAAGLTDEAIEDEAADGQPNELPVDEPLALNAAAHRPDTIIRLPQESELWHQPLAQTSAAAPAELPSMVSRREAAHYERQAQSRGLLVGGVVGYLLGRRRGRIKTEKRLKSVESKLTQQVSQIEARLGEKEVAIRQLARQRPVEARSLAKPQNTAMEAAPAVSRSQLERTAAVPASHSEKGAERITRAVPEAPLRPGLEAAQPTVETMNKSELLTFAATITVGETNLRRVYEAQLVDERGLRRLIREQQAGHDLRRALAREFLVKELKFERDPTLQDMVLAEQAPRQQRSNASQPPLADSGAPAPAGNSASQHADKSGQPASQRPPVTASTPIRPPRHRQTQVSSGLLVGLTAATIGLAIYALWLTITR